MRGKKLAKPFCNKTKFHMNPVPTVIIMAATGSRITYCIAILLAVGLLIVLYSYPQKDCLMFYIPTDSRIADCIVILLSEGLPTVLESN